MIKFEADGEFKKVNAWLKSLRDKKYTSIFTKYGELGVMILRENTPKKTGLTANSWFYKIVNNEDGTTSLEFHNSNIKDYVNIAMIIDTGHATKDGHFIAGYHYLEPSLQPVFEDLSKKLWKEVTSI